jgi:hypothetical protein
MDDLKSEYEPSTADIVTLECPDYAYCDVIPSNQVKRELVTIEKDNSITTHFRLMDDSRIKLLQLQCSPPKGKSTTSRMMEVGPHRVAVLSWVEDQSKCRLESM